MFGPREREELQNFLEDLLFDTKTKNTYLHDFNKADKCDIIDIAEAELENIDTKPFDDELYKIISEELNKRKREHSMTFVIEDEELVEKLKKLFEEKTEEYFPEDVVSGLKSIAKGETMYHDKFYEAIYYLLKQNNISQPIIDIENKVLAMAFIGEYVSKETLSMALGINKALLIDVHGIDSSIFLIDTPRWYYEIDVVKDGEESWYR